VGVSVKVAEGMTSVGISMVGSGMVVSVGPIVNVGTNVRVGAMVGVGKMKFVAVGIMAVGMNDVGGGTNVNCCGGRVGMPVGKTMGVTEGRRVVVALVCRVATDVVPALVGVRGTPAGAVSHKPMPRQ